MSIELHLTDHIPGETVYHPGGIIFGKLVLEGPIPDLPLAAYVRFLGFSRVNINNMWSPCYDIHFSDHREHVFLLPSRCPLADGETSVTNFSFKIPMNTMPGEFHVDERTSKYWNSGWAWHTDPRTGDHILPPSYSDPGCSVSIRYMLSARCQVFNDMNGEAVRNVLETKLRNGLCVRRRGISEQCDPKTMYTHTRRVPAAFGRQFDLHKAGFIIMAHLPSVVKIGELMPLSLELSRINECSLKQDKLEVRLLSVRHRVTRTALVRHSEFQHGGPRGPHVYGFPTDKITRTSQKQYFELENICKNSPRVLEYGVPTCLSKEVNAVLSNELHIATFKSYKVSVQYSSKTTVTVECRGQLHTLEFEVDDLTVLPSAPDSVAVEPVQETSSGEIRKAITSTQKHLVVQDGKSQAIPVRARS